MIEEATVDCYSEDEEFSGMVCTLQDKLKFPFDAIALGKTVKVIGLDESKSSLRRGVIAKVSLEGKSYTAALSTIQLLDEKSRKGKHNAKWIEAYKYWANY